MFWWASPAGSRSCSSTSCQRRKLLAVAGRRHAMGYNTITRRPRGTGDLDSRSSIRAWDWTSSGGYDRRPVSMALLRAKTGKSWPFLSGLSRRRSARLPLPYRQLSYYLFSSSFSSQTLTYRQTDRQTYSTHTHTQHLRHGELFGQRRRGHGNAHFFLVWFISWGVDTSHIIPVFFGDGGAPMKIPLYHTTSIPRIFVRCCTSPFLSND